MPPQNQIDIVIYDAPAKAAASGCACGCGGHGHSHGPDEAHHHHHHDPLRQVPMHLQAQALALTLEKKFPGRVTVEYINVLKDPRGPHLPQTKLLCSLVYPTPLVYIAGKGRFAGSLPVERIVAEVAALLTDAAEA